MRNFIEEEGDKIVWIFITLYVIFFTYLTFAKYYSFSYPDIDLAMLNQVMWNTLKGKVFYYSLYGRTYLGDHLALILFLLLPFYKIFPHPCTLLFLQTLFLGLGAFPLYLVAKGKVNKKFALGFAFCYLLYPALGHANLHEFHPVAFSTFFLLFTFYYFEKEDFKKFLAFVFLSLICQEDISLVIFMFGIYALLRRKNLKWILTPLLIGSFWFIIAVRFLIPRFIQSPYLYTAYYSNLGKDIPEVLKAVIFRPGLILKTVFTKPKIDYLIYLFGPLGFLSLIAPGTLIIALTAFLQNLLSFYRPLYTISYGHYTSAITPFIFISAIYGVKRVLKLKRIKTPGLILLLLLVATLFFNSLLGPHFHLGNLISRYQRDDLDREREKLVNLLPQGASVVTTFGFQPRLSGRDNLYTFHYVYTGRTRFGREYRIPPGVEYALIDFNEFLTFFRRLSAPEGDNNIRKFLKEGNWGIVEIVDNIALFKKNYKSDYKLYEIVEEPEIQNKVNAGMNEEIIFLGYDLPQKEVAKKERLPLIYWWKRLGETKENLRIFIRFIDKEKKVAYEQLRPLCYGVYPANKWKKGEIIKEYCWPLVPSRIPQGNYTLITGMFDPEGRITGKIVLEDIFIRDEEGK